jgi:hypothetical protein
MRAVLERDFVREASRLRAVVLRTLVAGVAIAGVALLLVDIAGPGASEDFIGRSLYSMGSMLLLSMLLLVTPPLVVGSVLAERQQGTLVLLLASPAGPTSIALAKVLSRAGVALLFAFGTIPALGLCLFFGGVAPERIAGTATAATALVLELAAWGVLVSSMTRKPATAVVLSFLLPAAHWTARILAVEALGAPPGPGAAVLFSGTPWPSLLAILQSSEPFVRRVGTGAKSPLEEFVREFPDAAFLGSSILLAALLVSLSGRILAREAEPPRRLPAFLSRLPGIARAKRQLRRRLRFENPIAWKETQLVDSSASRPLFYAVLAVLLGLLAISCRSLDRSRVVCLVLAIQIPLVAFVAAVNASLTLGHERTKGSWDLLRSSLLRPEQVVSGKVSGVLRGVGLLAVVPAALAVLGVVFGGIEFHTFLVALLLLAAMSGFWTAVGLSYGIRADRRREAVLRTCAVFGVLLVGFPLLGFVADMADLGSASEVLVVASPPLSVYWPLAAVEGRQEAIRGVVGFLWFLFLAGAGGALLKQLPGWLARRYEEERAG